MNLTEVLCFGAAPGQGNLAQVIEGDGWGLEQRQAWARTSRANACVFVDDGKVFDYFYPHARSPLCLHATLAAARVLFDRLGHAELEVRTAQRGQPLRLRETGGLIYVGLAPQQTPAVELPGNALSRWFAEAPEAVAPLAVASVGSPKLLLRVKDEAALDALRPQLESIVAWGRQSGVNGLYAWCELADGSLAGRNFNHLDPVMEDSATGVAAGALALHLRRDVTVRQGGNVGKPCVIRARYSPERIEVGGAAERVIDGR